MSMVRSMTYFFAQDSSCHWYLVEAARRDDWERWAELDEDDERSWEPPAYAKRLDGGVESMTFRDPLTREERDAIAEAREGANR